MRGTHDVIAFHTLRPGIIPAYAGNTQVVSKARCNVRDHLRVCGEHADHVDGFQCEPGSSPRMRGTLFRHGSFCHTLGIIPAYAGNTTCLVLSSFFCVGSSPRMRGTHTQACSRPSRHGIIPAYAGNTACNWRPFSHTRDHPRVCGEHCDGNTVCMLIYGIIPAYAGNTSPPAWPPSKNRDHPRVCGEHSARRTRGNSHLGSSPRMRGTLGFAIIFPSVFGIIPAYAGNTGLIVAICSRERDHPRVCGEHRGRYRTCGKGLGSSPRMRGTQYN